MLAKSSVKESFCYSKVVQSSPHQLYKDNKGSIFSWNVKTPHSPTMHSANQYVVFK